MQEALAAVIIQASAWHPHRAFVNPMCGSGTLAIEAALLRINRPPGLLRTNYAFMHLKTFSAARWEELRKEAQQAEVADVANLSPIVATDHDPEAVSAARQNAAAAGVEHLIRFEVADFPQTPVPSVAENSLPDGSPVAGSPVVGNPVIMVNPPYGSRLGEEEELKKLYAALGDFFKQRAAGYHAYIFTGNLALAKHVGLRTKSRTELYNGKLESRLLEYELYTGTR
jgi:putative N6-adenine-specific DNA methylase